MMCGRYTLAYILGLKTRFDVIDLQARIEPRFNIAPSEDAPVIVQEDVTKAVMMRWGLIPSWAKGTNIGNRLINARSETVDKRPAFRAALKRSRCLVPATGFYEWKKTDAGKVPYYVHLKNDSMFAFAGLHDRWKSPEGKEIRSYAIVTTSPNAMASKIHNRMPVILRREMESTWISKAQLTGEQLMTIFEPYPSREMDSYIVSKEVNNPHNDSENLIQPVQEGQRNL